MRTTLVIDDPLVEDVFAVSDAKTKRELVVQTSSACWRSMIQWGVVFGHGQWRWHGGRGLMALHRLQPGAKAGIMTR